MLRYSERMIVFSENDVDVRDKDGRTYTAPNGCKVVIMEPFCPNCNKLMSSCKCKNVDWPELLDKERKGDM